MRVATHLKIYLEDSQDTVLEVYLPRALTKDEAERLSDYIKALVIPDTETQDTDQ
jgi:hypothetical protein